MRAIAAMAVAGLLTASAARADGDGAERLHDIVPAKVSMGQVVTLVAARGYLDVRKIKRRGGAYEVQALDARGSAAMLRLSASTGEILAIDALEDDD